MTHKFQKFILRSKFKNLPVKIFVKESDKRSKVGLIINPGAFEEAWGDNNRYKYILLWLQKNLNSKPTIIAYQTSRLADVGKSKSETIENYWIRIFKGKTFQHELSDVRKVYEFLLAEKKFHLDTIYVVGFSLGGTFGLILSSTFKQIKKICLLGSAISTKRPNLPVLIGYPAKNWILNRASKFKNYIKLYQGYNEKIVPFDDQIEIISALKNPRYASLVRINKADHMFSGKNKYGLIYYYWMLNDVKNFFGVSI
ncbi:hypothetical protein HY357_00220 [Candidatus Roizmanbacteria bacterium]|nr:hypothetical protein [Candidatus Roizmanbacteria bacterium]